LGIVFLRFCFCICHPFADFFLFSHSLVGGSLSDAL
jgi:hypothetical protein